MSSTQTPDEIERDIAHERAALSETLDDLQSRLSLEGVVQQAGDYLRGNGGDIGQSVARSVKENPIALALTGIGLAWLIFGTGPRASEISGTAKGYANRFRGSDDDGYDYDSTGSGGTYYGGQRALSSPSTGPEWTSRSSIYDYDVDGGTTYGSTSDDSDGASMGDRAGEMAGSAKSGIAGAAGSARDGVAGAYGSARDSAAAGYDSARRGVANTAEGARMRAEAARRRIASGTEQLSEEARARVVAARERALVARDRAENAARAGIARSQDFFEEQPLVAGALALAVGAAIGGALPRTRLEDEQMGRESDALMHEAERVYHEERQKLGKVAQATMDEARSVAGETRREVDGATPDAGSVVDAVSERAREGAARVSDAAQAEADRQKLGSSVS